MKSNAWQSVFVLCHEHDVLPRALSQTLNPNGKYKEPKQGEAQDALFMQGLGKQSPYHPKGRTQSCRYHLYKFLGSLGVPCWRHTHFPFVCRSENSKQTNPRTNPCALSRFRIASGRTTCSASVIRAPRVGSQDSCRASHCQRLRGRSLCLTGIVVVCLLL